jgi:hypothetical protein
VGSILTRDAGVYLLCLCLVLISGIRSVHANSKSPAEQASDAEIAKELANPIADLIHIPVQINYNQNIGPDDDGWRVQTNIQPVIPFHMNDDWNLITRTIVPLIHQEDIFSGSGSQSGLGDTTISLLFSPKEPDSDGIIWGAGPIMQLPTATDSKLGTEKWGMGPSGIALRQNGPWTIGGLGHHIWSFAGDDDRDDLSITFCSHSWPTPGQARGLYPLCPRVVTTGRRRGGPFRSMLLRPR